MINEKIIFKIKCKVDNHTRFHDFRDKLNNKDKEAVFYWNCFLKEIDNALYNLGLKMESIEKKSKGN